MSTAPKYQPHYTVDDYMRWGGDWELWNGIPLSMSPSPNPRHQRVVSKLLQVLRNQLDRIKTCNCCEALTELDWKVSHDTVVRPDVLITCDPLPPTHITSPPVFIAEVLSPATSNKDQTVKRELYQSQGIKYYLTADPDSKRCNLLELNDNYYQTIIAAGSQADASGKYLLQLTEQCSIEFQPTSIF